MGGGDNGLVPAPATIGPDPNEVDTSKTNFGLNQPGIGFEGHSSSGSSDTDPVVIIVSFVGGFVLLFVLVMAYMRRGRKKQQQQQQQMNSEAEPDSKFGMVVGNVTGNTNNSLNTTAVQQTEGRKAGAEGRGTRGEVELNHSTFEQHSRERGREVEYEREGQRVWEEERARTYHQPRYAQDQDWPARKGADRDDVHIAIQDKQGTPEPMGRSSGREWGNVTKEERAERADKRVFRRSACDSPWQQQQQQQQRGLEYEYEHEHEQHERQRSRFNNQQQAASRVAVSKGELLQNSAVPDIPSSSDLPLTLADSSVMPALVPVDGRRDGASNAVSRALEDPADIDGMGSLRFATGETFAQRYAREQAAAADISAAAPSANDSFQAMSAAAAAASAAASQLAAAAAAFGSPVVHRSDHQPHLHFHPEQQHPRTPANPSASAAGVLSPVPLHYSFQTTSASPAAGFDSSYTLPAPSRETNRLRQIEAFFEQRSNAYRPYRNMQERVPRPTTFRRPINRPRRLPPMLPAGFHYAQQNLAAMPGAANNGYGAGLYVNSGTNRSQQPEGEEDDSHLHSHHSQWL